MRKVRLILEVVYFSFTLIVMLRFGTICTIKKRKKRTRLLLLVNLQASAGNFTKSNISPSVLFALFKLYKWYQIAQSAPVDKKNLFFPKEDSKFNQIP